MAKVEETETSFEGVPPGEYIAFYAGFVPRDDDTMRPRFIEVDEWKNNQKTGNRIPAILWGYEVVYPEEHRGGTATGKTNWKGIKVTTNAKGENVVQVERVGTLIPYLIKWSEVCGVDWGVDLSGLPDKGQITDQMIAEALDAALLEHAREGVLVVIKVGERGYVDSSQSDCVMPLPAGPAAKKVEGVEYTVPDFYGGGYPAGAVVGGSWTEAELDALRGHIREALQPALTAGASVLTNQEANDKRLLAQAIQAGGGDYAARAAHFAQGMAEGGFDAVEGNLLVRMVSMVTGAPVPAKGEGGIVDSLAPPQLEGAARCLTDIARSLGKEVPDPPMLEEPEDIDDEIPF